MHGAMPCGVVPYIGRLTALREKQRKLLDTDRAHLLDVGYALQHFFNTVLL